MSDETILTLFDDVCDLLLSLQSELSCITTSDTGSDPTEHIQDCIDDLREKLAALTAVALPQSETAPNPVSSTKKDLPHDVQD